MWPHEIVTGLVMSLILASAASPLRAAPGPSNAREPSRDLWDFIQQIRSENPDDTALVRQTLPRAIPAAAQGGTTIDIGDLTRPVALEAALERATAQADSELSITVPGGQARAGAFSIGSDQSVDGHLLILHGNAEVFGRLRGNLVTFGGNVIVHPGAVVAGDILAIHGDVINRGGEVQGEVLTLTAPPTRNLAPSLTAGALTMRRLAGVLGVFLALSVLAWVLSAFGSHHLQIVSDTASLNFGRSFVTGLIGQILVLPTFGMLVVGLILSVAGILLLPFAVVVFALLLVVGVVGGFLAVAHAMGETYTRRRMAAGLMLGAPGHVRFILVGLASTLTLWVAWALFGWVPVAGTLMWGAAVIATWMLGTAGFGAALLSRAGVQPGFAGRIIPPEALTDEYLWATPRFGVAAVQRPGSSAPPTRR